MIRDFSREELEPLATSNDTELTLGGGILLVLAGGLLILCAVCFGLGYMVGHRTIADQAESAAKPQVPAKAATAPPGSGAKPGAGAAVPQHLAKTTAEGTDSQTGDTKDASHTSPAVVGSGLTQPRLKPAVDSEVRPALGGQTGGAQSAGTLKVQPATTQVQGWMVQIAAISRPEDAAVLVSALQRRGYEVTARRDLGDNLIHVQTGPFANRNDANAMRQKLLNDGYNAIVQ